MYTIPKGIDGKVLSEDLTEYYEVSAKRSHSVRIPFFVRWKRVMREGNLEGAVWNAVINEPVRSIAYTFDGVKKYLATHFGPGVGTHPQYDTYQAYQLVRERFAHGGVVFTFENLPAPDSFAALDREYKHRLDFVHVRIRSQIVSSWEKWRDSEDWFT